MIIYCRTKKSKPRKSPKPQRDQYQSWLKSVQSMTTNFSNSKIRSTKVASDAVVRATFVRPTEKYRSVDTGVGNATKFNLIPTKQSLSGKTVEEFSTNKCINK